MPNWSLKGAVTGKSFGPLRGQVHPSSASRAKRLPGVDFLGQRYV